MKRRALVYILPLLCGMLLSVTAGGEWSVRRYDVARTAHKEGVSDLDSIAPLWRLSVGGWIDESQFIAGDFNGDSEGEIVLISGGRLFSKKPEDIILWETPRLHLNIVWIAEDIDGDGTQEIVASANHHKVFIFSGADGSILWELESGVIGTPKIVQLHDYDGDGLSDLYIADCYHCSVRTRRTVIYSFSAGFDHPSLLLELERRENSGAIAEDMFIDADGDGERDIVVLQTNELLVHDVTDGSVRHTSGDVGCMKVGNILYASDVDSNGLPDFFVFTNFYRES